MKKLLFLIAGLVLCGTLSAQFVIFGNVPKDIFPTSADSDKAVNGVFLWSLDAVVSGAEITYNNDAFETKFLSGVGGAIGWKHRKVNTPITNRSAVR